MQARGIIKDSLFHHSITIISIMICTAIIIASITMLNRKNETVQGEEMFKTSIPLTLA